MIKTENININGRHLIKTYSDEGFMVERDGSHFAYGDDYTVNIFNTR